MKKNKLNTNKNTQRKDKEVEHFLKNFNKKNFLWRSNKIKTCKFNTPLIQYLLKNISKTKL